MIQMKPTRYQDITLSTGASLIDEDALWLGRLLRQVEETDAMLQRLREQQYADCESVFDVTAADAVDALAGERLLPDRKLDIIDGTVAMQWETTYQAVLYQQDHARRFMAPDDEDLPSNGRLDWMTALETYRENNRGDSWVIEWCAEDVDAHTVAGQPVLDCPLANGETMRVLPNEDVSDWLPAVDEVRVVWHPPRERQVIGDLTDFEPEEIEVTLGHVDHPRQAVSQEGPDSEVSASHDQLLANCDDPYADDGEMSVIVDIIREGYFTKSEQLRYLLFLAREQDVIRVPYGYSIPYLIDKFVDAVDARATHVPQTGDVLLSREPLDDMAHLAEAFPEKQQLTAVEEREIRGLLGHPESSITFMVEEDTVGGVLATERVAQLFHKGVLTESDVFAHQFANYIPAPTEDAIFTAVEDGKDTLAALDAFDAAYGTTAGGDLRREVAEYGYLIRNY